MVGISSKALIEVYRNHQSRWIPIMEIRRKKDKVNVALGEQDPPRLVKIVEIMLAEDCQRSIYGAVDFSHPVYDETGWIHPIQQRPHPFPTEDDSPRLLIRLKRTSDYPGPYFVKVLLNQHTYQRAATIEAPETFDSTETPLRDPTKVDSIDEANPSLCIFPQWRKEMRYCNT